MIRPGIHWWLPCRGCKPQPFEQESAVCARVHSPWVAEGREPYGEADTRAKLIDPALYAVGWAEEHMRREETAGGIAVIGGEARRVSGGRVDYTLRPKASTSSQLQKALFVCDRDELRSQSLNAFRNLFGAEAAKKKRNPACPPNHRPWLKVCKSASTPPDAGSRPPSMAAMPASRWRNNASASPSVSSPKRRTSPTSATSESIRPSVMAWPIVRSIFSGGWSPESRIVRSPRALAGRGERASACWRSNCAPAANPGSRRIWA